MSSILDEIVDRKRDEIAVARSIVPEAELRARIRDLPVAYDFRQALTFPPSPPGFAGGEGAGCPVAIIAEVKRRSPSAGELRPDFDPVAIARAYAANGAAAISVLTDEPFFGGHLDHLRQIRADLHVPLLRKEFVLESYQLLEARVAGADACLLIAEILPGPLLHELVEFARDIGLATLVELHDAEQIPRVVASGAAIIGINNRDLRSFQTRLEHTLTLRHSIPLDRLVVSESGIRTPADLRRLAEAKVQAALVGESLVRQPDPGEALRRLRTL